MPLLEDKLAQIERAAMNLELSRTELESHDLRLGLIDVLCLIERDPGIEAATDDLYETALAVVNDAPAGSASVRRRRLLSEARRRYRERLANACPAERVKG